MPRLSCEGLKWGVVVALAAYSSIQLQGCFLGYRTLRYPSPEPVGVAHFVYPIERIAAAEPGHAGLKGFEYVCTMYILGPGAPTRDSVAFSVEGADFCFNSPTTGGVQSNRPLCMSSFGTTLSSHPVTFQAYVSGNGVALDQPRATLEVNGNSSAAGAQVQSAPYMGTAEEAPPGAKVSNPKAPLPEYEVPRWQLNFSFDQPCDPTAHYQLTITGITMHGRQVQVPPVDFSPHEESSPMVVD